MSGVFVFAGAIPALELFYDKIRVMNSFFVGISAIYGLIAGSFLNVGINRLKTGENMVRSRSRCPDCGHTLHWYELLPLISFFVQRRRCRNCNKKISWQYPAVEAATALLFALSAYHVTLTVNTVLSIKSFELLFLWFVIGSLLVLFVYDLKHFIIPDKVLFPLIGVTILAFVVNIWEVSGYWIFNSGYWGNLLAAVFTGFIFSLPFLALHLASQGKSFGLGDVKLIFFMGLLLGWPNIFVALFIAFVSGAIMGVSMMLSGKADMQSKLPFGPFLIAGTWTALFWGQDLIHWYFSIFS